MVYAGEGEVPFEAVYGCHSGAGEAEGRVPPCGEEMAGRGFRMLDSNSSEREFEYTCCGSDWCVRLQSVCNDPALFQPLSCFQTDPECDPFTGACETVAEACEEGAEYCVRMVYAGEGEAPFEAVYGCHSGAGEADGRVPACGEQMDGVFTSSWGVELEYSCCNWGPSWVYVLLSTADCSFDALV
eukprot:3941243-Rhodomonas_salina.5